jgi:hypothetical protein
MGSALFYEQGDVLAFQKVRDPLLFPFGCGQGCIATSGVAGVAAILGWPAMACDGKVDGTSGLGIFGKDMIW